MSEPTNDSNAAAIIAAVKSTQIATSVTIRRGSNDEAQTIAIPADMKLVSIKGSLDEYLQKPERAKGVAAHSELPSFIAHANSFKRDSSAVFAVMGEAFMQVIYDYHSKDSTSFNEHRGAFKAAASRQWQTWLAQNGEAMGQADFATFIEDNALDLIDPPATDSIHHADSAILNVSKTLGSPIASASKIRELARGIAINEASSAKSFINPNTGEVQIEYAAEHNDSAGAKLKVPNLFLIAIPVYEGEHSYRVLVRLRYRLAGGRVSWFFSLYQPEQCVEDAFGEMCTKVATETGLPVYRGSPE